MAEIELATVLPGAKPFRENNVNDTFRGQVLLSDGTTKSAILKDLDQIQLSNEVLASILAHRVGLPTPQTYIALVRGDDLTVTKAPRLEDGNRIVFASVDVKLPNITFSACSVGADEKLRIFQDILAWADLGHLYAFDSWVANTDRHPGNLLFGGKNEIWLIDHGHCFSGPDWKPDDLDPHGVYRNRLSEWVTNHLSSEQRRQRAAEINQLGSVIASINLAVSRRESKIDALLSPAHGTAIENFLSGRAQEVSIHANRALGILA